MKINIKSLILLIICGLLLTAANLAKKSYTIDKEASEITWKGEKVIGGSHEGTIELESGTLVMSGDDLAGGEFVIDMSTMKNTDLEDEESRGKLMGHLKSDDFFGVEKHPKAMFKITSVEKMEEEQFKVTGDLTIKDHTETISFNSKISKRAGDYEAESTIVFDRSKFDVRYGSGSFFDDLGNKAISDDISINIHLYTK